MSIQLNKIIDRHETIIHMLISLNCEMLRQNNSILSGEERLKNDIKANEDICLMNTCMWNINGKCNQNGKYNVLKQCRESNYKFFESDNPQVDKGYLGKC